MFDTDLVIDRWCAHHLGIVSLDEWFALGLDAESLKRRARARRLVRLHEGVYLHAAHPVTPEGAIRAAVLAGGAGAYASGPSLMRLYGVRGEWSERPEITLLGTEHRRLEGVRVRRIDRLDPVDVQPRLGIPALAPPLGLLLLGATTPWRVTSAVHDMVFQRYTTRPQLIDVAARYGNRGRRGTTAFRKGVKTLDPSGRATQTNFELDAVTLLVGGGVPEPHLQYPVVVADGTKKRLDLAWPDVMLNVETDGDRWHLNPADRARDAKRDAALQTLGWHVVRLGSPEVYLRPAQTLAVIRSFFGT